jgi:hypothetical protein
MGLRQLEFLDFPVGPHSVDSVRIIFGYVKLAKWTLRDAGGTSRMRQDEFRDGA